MTAPVSACIITRDDPHVIRAIASVRRYVAEVVVVDTGTDWSRWQGPRPDEVADVVLHDRECNGSDGLMADFSRARSISFAVSTQPWKLWLDSDDVVEGLEGLQDILAEADRRRGGMPMRILCPYEYAHDERGACTSILMRERIVSPAEAFEWQRPVHEVLRPREGVGWVDWRPEDAPVWKHRRSAPPDPRRNLRILRRYAEAQGSRVDLATAFNLGTALAKSGQHIEAIAHLRRYVEESGWDQERVLACLQLVEILSFYPGQEKEALSWAHRAQQICPGSAVPEFALAKLCYRAAERGGPDERRNLDRARHYALRGLGRPDLMGVVTVNPLDRTHRIPRMLLDIYKRTGNRASALQMVDICLDADPQDVGLRLEFAHLWQATHPEEMAGKLHVVIACAMTPEPWDPSTMEANGIGGSETAVIEVAKRLAAMSIRVQVFARVAQRGLYDGVEYQPLEEIGDVAKCDLLIAWRNARLMEAVPAREKWVWAHDTEIADASDWTLTLADRILALSDWHADLLRGTHPRHASKVWVTRNGLDLTRFDPPEAVERQPHRAIYSSSPDRGLEELLAMWPRIRARVPDAELHIYYGDALLMMHDTGRATEIRQRIASLSADGVKSFGRIDQRALAGAMLAAGVWLYPTAFCETSCITAQEAMASGLRMVTSPVAALRETAVGARFVDGDPRSPKYQTEFIESAVSAMTAAEADMPLSRHELREAARRAYDWNGVVGQWHGWMRTMRGPIPAAHTGKTVIHMVWPEPKAGRLSREGAFGELARALGSRGTYHVRAFASFEEQFDESELVEWVRLDQRSPTDTPAVVIAWGDASALPPPRQDGFDPLTMLVHLDPEPRSLDFERADVNFAHAPELVDRLRDRYDPTGRWDILSDRAHLAAAHLDATIRGFLGP